MTTPDFDAVVLAGGRARRFGGADKPGALIEGRPLVARVAEAATGATRLILVGPPRPELPQAITVREDPPGGGPIPALRAGLPEAHAPWLVLLAADLPFLTRTHIAHLREAATRHGVGAILLDEDDRPQWLIGCWRTTALRAALSIYQGASLGGLLDPLQPTTVRLPAGSRPPWYDVDTPESFEQARTLMEEPPDPRSPSPPTGI